MAIRLVVNADDFALSPAVSRGIIDSHRDGIVTSTTVMVNWPWSATCVALLATVPDLGTGLHLNLTAGPPVLSAAAVPTLVGPDGRFQKDLRHLQAVSPTEVHREWSAQVRRFVDLVGRLPTHLDGHHHVHLLPRLVPVAVAVAREFGIPAIRGVELGDLLAARPWYRWRGPEWGQALLLLRSGPALARSGLVRPRRVIGLFDFDRQRLIRWLAGVTVDATELVCHPGYVDDELATVSGRLAPRPQEVADLTHPDVRRAAERPGLQLVSYAGLVPKGR